ncbi:MAG: glycosyltransferase family 1 protein [Candidatus Levybacteria bacterium]|nr:glycosyltransferase family 1 protein [Candidatus Levybacteria bacterium]
MSMIIGIDANEANVERRVGISEYAYQILLNLYEFRKHKKNNYTFVIYLKSNPLGELPEETEWWKYKVVKPAKLWTQIGLPFHLVTTLKRPDVFLTLTHYAPRIAPVPTIVSVMDLSFLHFPETFRKNDLFQLTRWTEYSVKKASRIITISKSTKDDIIKYYKIPDDKISVVHLGLKMLSMEQTPSDLKDFGITKKFILFVGTLQPRKNISRLIEAFSILPRKIQEEYQLVIVGKKGWLYEDILNAPKKYGVEKDTLFLDYVKDHDLPQFYRKAEVFVLPSLYEGFGLPVLEAMRYGCPVITSNISSLPEAGGDAALYVDPENTQEIADKISEVLKDNTLRQSMIDKGNIHYKKFTWEKAASEVLAAVEKVVSAK